MNKTGKPEWTKAESHILIGKKTPHLSNKLGTLILSPSVESKCDLISD